MLIRHNAPLTIIIYETNFEPLLMKKVVIIMELSKRIHIFATHCNSLLSASLANYGYEGSIGVLAALI